MKLAFLHDSFLSAKQSVKHQDIVYDINQVKQHDSTTDWKSQSLLDTQTLVEALQHSFMHKSTRDNEKVAPCWQIFLFFYRSACRDVRFIVYQPSATAKPQPQLVQEDRSTQRLPAICNHDTHHGCSNSL